MSGTRVPERHEVPEAERWDKTSVFVTPSAWEAAFELARARLEEALGYRGTLHGGPEALYAWLEFEGALSADLGKLAVYAGMDYACNTRDEDAAARYDRVRGLLAQATAAVAFAEPEILALGAERVRRWAAAPPLDLYAHYLERLLDRAEHTRSAEVEALLGALENPFDTATSAHGVLANTDLVFEPVLDADGEAHELTQSSVRTLLGSPDRTLRAGAYRTYAAAHALVQHTMATLLSAGVKQNLFLAEARAYPSALEAALDPEKIPASVFHTLLATFRANLGVWHRYWRARRRLLGLETLEPCDTFAPLAAPDVGPAPVIPFERSVAWLTSALAPLGETYTAALERGAFNERWVDRAVNQGKRMGAFSTGVRGTHPFIMMSYTEDVFGMSTLAHEFGHSLHSYLTWGAQPQVYSRYSLFVAEVASNFNQAVLRAYLFEALARDPEALAASVQSTPRAFELALIEEAMANFYRYFFVMPTLARFELALHERTARGEALSAGALNALMAELFAEGYGGEMVFDPGEVGLTWAQFHTHLYSCFYSYQYATGLSGAHALAAPILAGDAEAAARYGAFLRAGGRGYPLDALRSAGVDLSTPEPVEATFAVLAGLVARLEALAA